MDTLVAGKLSELKGLWNSCVSSETLKGRDCLRKKTLKRKRKVEEDGLARV